MPVPSDSARLKVVRYQVHSGYQKGIQSFDWISFCIIKESKVGAVTDGETGSRNFSVYGVTLWAEKYP